MNSTKIFFPIIGLFLLQFLLSDFLSIKGIRPDFILIYILYTSIRYGNIYGVIVGFFLGILVDLVGVGSFFGLTSLTFVITGYLAGFLQDKNDTMIPAYFHLNWFCIVLIHFFVYSFVRYQDLFENNLYVFWSTWFWTTGYTCGFLLILQMIYPIQEFD